MALRLGLLLASVTPLSLAAQPGVIENLLLATIQRPWLWGVYVFTVGLPIILFISFMWPDKTNRAAMNHLIMSLGGGSTQRFGPADQQYYYKKSDDAQPDDPESSQQAETTDMNGKADRAVARRRDTHGKKRKSDLDFKDD